MISNYFCYSKHSLLHTTFTQGFVYKQEPKWGRTVLALIGILCVVSDVPWPQDKDVKTSKQTFMYDIS